MESWLPGGAYQAVSPGVPPALQVGPGAWFRRPSPLFQWPLTPSPQTQTPEAVHASLTHQSPPPRHGVLAWRGGAPGLGTRPSCYPLTGGGGVEAGVAPLLPPPPHHAPHRALRGTHFPVLPSPPSEFPARRPGQEGQGGGKPWQDKHCPPRPGSTEEEQAGAKSGTGRAIAPGAPPTKPLHLGSHLLTWSQSPLSRVGPA